MQQIVHLDFILPYFIDGLSQIFQVCANWPWRSILSFKFYDTENVNCLQIVQHNSDEQWVLEFFINIDCC